MTATDSVKIILVTTPDTERRLDYFVEECLRAGIKWIAVVGDECSRIEDMIDELVVGDGSDLSRFIMTTWHENQSLSEVVEFMSSLKGEYAGETKVVQLIAGSETRSDKWRLNSARSGDLRENCQIFLDAEFHVSVRQRAEDGTICLSH
eukprot:gene33461-38903_t